MQNFFGLCLRLLCLLLPFLLFLALLCPAGIASVSTRTADQVKLRIDGRDYGTTDVDGPTGEQLKKIRGTVLRHAWRGSRTPPPRHLPTLPTLPKCMAKKNVAPLVERSAFWAARCGRRSRTDVAAWQAAEPLLRGMGWLEPRHVSSEVLGLRMDLADSFVGESWTSPQKVNDGRAACSSQQKCRTCRRGGGQGHGM